MILGRPEQLEFDNKKLREELDIKRKEYKSLNLDVYWLKNLFNTIDKHPNKMIIPSVIIDSYNLAKRNIKDK